MHLPRPVNSRALLFLPFVEDSNSLFLGIPCSVYVFFPVFSISDLVFLFVEIMGTDIDFKKLRARVGSRRDLIDNF